MNKGNLFRMITSQFFVCYTCTMMATIGFTSLSDPPVTQIDVCYLWQAALFSLCAVLPGLLYYSKEELSRRQYWIRTAIHTVLLEVILMVLGHVLDMYRGILGGICFFLTVLVVDGAVRFFTFLEASSTANAINRALAQRRKQGKSNQSN